MIMPSDMTRDTTFTTLVASYYVGTDSEGLPSFIGKPYKSPEQFKADNKVFALCIVLNEMLFPNAPKAKIKIAIDVGDIDGDQADWDGNTFVRELKPTEQGTAQLVNICKSAIQKMLFNSNSAIQKMLFNSDLRGFYHHQYSSLTTTSKSPFYKHPFMGALLGISGTNTNSISVPEYAFGDLLKGKGIDSGAIIVLEWGFTILWDWISSTKQIAQDELSAIAMCRYAFKNYFEYLENQCGLLCVPSIIENGTVKDYMHHDLYLVPWSQVASGNGLTYYCSPAITQQRFEDDQKYIGKENTQRLEVLNMLKTIVTNNVSKPLPEEVLQTLFRLHNVEYASTKCKNGSKEVQNGQHQGTEGMNEEQHNSLQNAETTIN